jgi:BirA family biotin operon repressor/biotin-[acetyl-CoA-carboxylase] ligase
MDQESIEGALAGLPLGPIRYFESATSTNDLARDWARGAAPDLSLVIADEQTAGKGRSGRSWITPAGAALAFSLVLRPERGEGAGKWLPRLGGAAGLAIASAFESLFGLQPELKWPNDVLLRGKKAAGVLIEIDWDGDQAQSIVVGIGINVFERSIPRAEMLRFPATSLETEIGTQPDRLPILAEILQAFLAWRGRPADEVIRAWESMLAYKGRTVELSGERGQAHRGRLEGLERNGALRLRLPSGETVSPPSGDLTLRLVDSLPE